MSTRRAPCPRCDRGPRDRALAITTDARGTVSYCHRCGYTEHIASKQHGITAPTGMRARTESLDWSHRAESIWCRAQPLRGTLGQTYLEHRGCVLPPRDSDLRYLPGVDRYPPSL